MLKKIIQVFLLLMTGLVAGITFYGCKKTEPEKEPISWQENSYEQCRIMFMSSRDGNYEIYTIKPDGNDLTRLTNNPALDRAPAWSPDAGKIAFVRDLNSLEQPAGEKNLEIYTMNADGSEQIRLTDDIRNSVNPSWSPDGKKIAFYSFKDAYSSDWEIYVINPNGKKKKKLTDNNAYSPNWSPDGKKIAYNSTQGTPGSEEIYIMNADGSNKRNLTNNNAMDVFSQWSPEGGKIAFMSQRDGNSEIYVMNPDGSEQINLTNNPLIDTGPRWSPDGKKILFVRFHTSEDDDNEQRNLEIYIMNADGSEQKRLTNSPGIDFWHSWSPDCRKIVFMSSRDGNYEIYTMNPDGSDQQNITNNPAPDMYPSWSPYPLVPPLHLEEIPREKTALASDLLKQEKYAQAAVELKKLTKNYSNYIDVITLHGFLHVCYVKLGNDSEMAANARAAIEKGEEFLKECPDRYDLYCSIGVYYMFLEQLENARDSFQKYLNLEAASEKKEPLLRAKTQMKIAETYENENKWLEMVQEYQKIVDDSDNPINTVRAEAQFHIAEVYNKHGVEIFGSKEKAKQQALSAYQKVATLLPERENPLWRKQAEEKITELGKE